MAGRAVGADPREPRPAGAGCRAHARRRATAAAGLGPLRRPRVDARHDGDRPQPGPQRRDGRWAGGVDAQRAVRVGLLSALHHDVRQRGARDQARGVRRAARRDQGSTRRGHRSRGAGRRAAQARRVVQGPRDLPHRQSLPAGSARAAAPGHQRRLRLVVRQEGGGVPPDQLHPRRVGHGGDRDGDGLRQPRGRIRHRRRLHARSAHRRAALLRRVPDQRAGRGRGGRHPHSRAHRRSAAPHAGDLRRAPRHRRPPGASLQGHAGHRVHDPGGQALPAADAVGQALGECGGAGGRGPRAGVGHRPAHRALARESTRPRQAVRAAARQR